MIISRKDEIKNILRNFLIDECIDSILAIETSENHTKALNHWITICLYNRKTFVYSKENIVVNLHSQIKRMNGDLKKIREENEQIRILEEQNRLWADAWMRSVRF